MWLHYPDPGDTTALDRNGLAYRSGAQDTAGYDTAGYDGADGGAGRGGRAGRKKSGFLSGPAAGHPERMCREAPLTRAERMLMAEIDGIGTDGNG
jgi:hypothetical protein